MLRVNLDETSLKLHLDPKPGIVLEPCPKKRRRLLRECLGPDLQTRRSAVTLIAFACDDESVQALLPQVFVVNEHVVTKAEVGELNDRCGGSNVLVVRRKSSWVNADFMIDVVNVLGTCLQSQLATHRVVLHMDICTVHTHAEVLNACSAKGIYAHFIPASTTAWLQPLDVAVFGQFKRWVLREVENQLLQSESGALSRFQVLDVYRRGVDAVIRARAWGQAFDQCGLRGQGSLSSRLLVRLGYSGPPLCESGLPSLDDLQAISRKGSTIPTDELFSLVLRREAEVRAASLLRLAPRARLPKAPGCF